MCNSIIKDLQKALIYIQMVVCITIDPQFKLTIDDYTAEGLKLRYQFKYWNHVNI